MIQLVFTMFPACRFLILLFSVLPQRTKCAFIPVQRKFLLALLAECTPPTFKYFAPAMRNTICITWRTGHRTHPAGELINIPCRTFRHQAMPNFNIIIVHELMLRRLCFIKQLRAYVLTQLTLTPDWWTIMQRSSMVWRLTLNDRNSTTPTLKYLWAKSARCHMTERITEFCAAMPGRSQERLCSMSTTGACFSLLNQMCIVL